MDARPPLRPAVEVRVFTCGVAARWLPRVLAGAILAAAMLAALRFAPYRALAMARIVQGAVCVTGLAAAAWILRSASAESRSVIALDDEGLFLAQGRRNQRLEFERIERFEFDWPLGPSRRLWPATVLVDREGRVWRIPAVVDDGAALIDELLERTRRDDLREWATCLNLARRMGHARWIVGAGYGTAAAFVVAAVAFYVG